MPPPGFRGGDAVRSGILVRCLARGSAKRAGACVDYSHDASGCLVKSISGVYDFGAQSHEFYLWHDPANPYRILVYMTIWTPAVPDPNEPGRLVADLYVLAITDEHSGEILKEPRVAATFTLQDAAGPRINEKPDADTGAAAPCFTCATLQVVGHREVRGRGRLETAGPTSGHCGIHGRHDHVIRCRQARGPAGCRGRGSDPVRCRGERLGDLPGKHQGAAARF